jgi:flagellar hook-basal body complex protein FliE
MSPILPTGMGLSPIPPIQPPASLVSGAANAAPAAGAGSAFQDFGSLLSQAIDSINGTQAAADTAATQVLTGQSQDLSGAMIAMQKATVTFDLATQVRDKTLDAYNELMHTQM